MLAKIVFCLCALTSLLCAISLLKRYKHSKVPLLFWSGLCFAALTVNNVLLIVDLMTVPGPDLSVLRTFPAFIGMALLVYGLLNEVET